MTSGLFFSVSNYLPPFYLYIFQFYSKASLQFDFFSFSVYFLNVWNEERGINSLKSPQRIWKAKLVPDKDGCVRFPNRSDQSPLFVSWGVPWEPSKDLEKASGTAGSRSRSHYHSGFSRKSMFPLCWRMPLPSLRGYHTVGLTRRWLRPAWLSAVHFPYLLH